MPRKKSTPFATDAKGERLYIRVKDCGITTLVFFIDGLPITFFGKEKTAYADVETVAAWHEKEYQYTKLEKYRKCAEALRDIMKKFKAGELADA